MRKAIFIFSILLPIHVSLAHVGLNETLPTSFHTEEISGTKGRLLRGERLRSKADYQALYRRGVRAILSLQGGDFSNNPPIVAGVVKHWEKGETPQQRNEQRLWAKEAGLFYMNLPINSLKKIDDFNADNMDQAMRYMHKYEEKGGDLGALYIHCAHGVDRTGLVLALYRVVYHAWPVDAAYAEWRRSGHTLANMTATWRLDQYFLAYMYRLAKSGFPVSISKLCALNFLL